MKAFSQIGSAAQFRVPRWVSGLTRSVVLPALCTLACATAVSQSPTLRIGQAVVHLQPKPGDEALPAAPHRSPALMQRAAPTSQWYSTLIFSTKPQPVYAQPLSVRPSAAGLEISLPQKEVWPTPRKDTQIAYPHREPVVIGSTAVDKAGWRLESTSDWAIRLRLAATQGSADMQATIAHGSPYVHLDISSGDLILRLPAPARRHDAADDPRRLALAIGPRHYAFFLPTGGAWEQRSEREWIGKLPPDRRYATAAVLPDASPQSLALISRHAYVHTTDTRVDWEFDAARSRVRTAFRATTQVREGADVGPLYGLYPHHWHQNPSVQAGLGPAFDTVLGPIRLLASAAFSTEYAFYGFVPFLPGLTDPGHRSRVAELTGADVRNARRMMLPEGQSAYWQGKGFQRILKLADVLEQEGRVQEAQPLIQGITRRMEEWLGGEDRKRYFFLDRRLGVLATHPNEFHAVEEINDQHFWFGYWVRTAAELALRDRQWADPQRWGAAIDLMVRNIANGDRSRTDFPFLRTFDPYEGHSWANGLGGVGETGFLGNNQESSSEALNAWAGLLLWAEVRGDRQLRDLAAYLYATEWQAVEHYWFDVHGLVLPKDYRNVDVAMLFGAGYAHNTWWTDEPRQITGINLLPITTSSMPLARHPAYVRRNLAALQQEEALAASRGVRGKPTDIWQDIFAKYLAMIDPPAALAQWNRWGAVELGETRSATLHWLLSLQELGTPDFTVTADHPLYSVLRRPDGQKTYLAYNAGSQVLKVNFSDGTTLEVPPGRLGQRSSPSPH